MKAADIMTSPVVSVSPDAPIRQVAALLSERGISGVPVLEDERLVGLVSEADLLRRRRTGPRARCASDVMVQAVVTVSADTPVAAVAALLEERGFKRVPVLEQGRLVGIVSRSNLLQALALSPEEEHDDDEGIRAALLADLERQPWWAHDSNVIVAGGVVHFWGARHDGEPREAAAATARAIAGVRRVEDHRFPAREPRLPLAQVRLAAERGHSRHGWVDAWHSFSFGNYCDPAHDGYGPLRAINEKRVQPGKGSTTYGLRDVEVVTYMLEGALGYDDSLNGAASLLPGSVQCLSAGSGVRFSETNTGESPCRFLQIWIEADRAGLPASCSRADLPGPARRGRLRLVVSPDGVDGSLRINQDVRIYAGLFDGGERAQVEVGPARLAYVHAARGAITARGEALGEGDGLAGSAGPLVLERGRAAEVLVFDLPEASADAAAKAR
jgi:redox-sensitive bicupin YhaK (pirin superfamily)/CBS domain-containing protein